jgi:hypothetical protein
VPLYSLELTVRKPVPDAKQGSERRGLTLSAPQQAGCFRFTRDEALLGAPLATLSRPP